MNLVYLAAIVAPLIVLAISLVMDHGQNEAPRVQPIAPRPDQRGITMGHPGMQAAAPLRATR